MKCENCHKKSIKFYRDNVSNKVVCQRCMRQAIDYGIRFMNDFDQYSEGVNNLNEYEVEVKFIDGNTITVIIFADTEEEALEKAMPTHVRIR